MVVQHHPITKCSVNDVHLETIIDPSQLSGPNFIRAEQKLSGNGTERTEVLEADVETKSHLH